MEGEVARRVTCCLCTLQMSTHLITTHGARWAARNSWQQQQVITYRFWTNMEQGGGGLSH